MARTRDEGLFFEYVQNNDLFGGIASKAVLVEGDSWAYHPFVSGALANQVDSLGKNDFAVLDIAHHGDEASEMLAPGTKQRRELDRLTISKRFSFTFDMIFISAGGNDIGNGLKTCIKDKQQHPGLYGKELIDDAKYAVVLSEIASWYCDFLDSLPETANANAKVVTHCYDYFIPRPYGTPILGIPLSEGDAHRHLIKHHIEDREEMFDITSTFLNRLLDSQKKLENDYSNLTVADTLGTLNGNDGGPDLSHWYDEIHPNSEGFRKIAKKIRKEARIRGCWPD